jgi:fructokinase
MAADHLRVTGQKLDALAIGKAAEAGGTEAQATLARWRERLARALAVVINILDPDVVVIGGGLSRLDSLYGTLPDLLSKWCFSDSVSTPVRPALHGDASGVRGAAWLWPPDNGDRR